MPDVKKELSVLQSNLRCYQYLIDEHDKHVEEAAQNIRIAKVELQNILDQRERAPKLVADTKKRITILEIAMKRDPTILKFDPKVKKLLILKQKLRDLEKEMGIE